MKKTRKKIEKSITYISLFSTLLATIACQSTSNNSATDLAKNLTKSVTPSLNSKIDLSINTEDHHSPKIVITRALLPFFSVSRKKTELRKGPGLSFSIKDSYLKNNDRVLILDRHSIWRKVYAPEREQLGWVHYKTLNQLKSSSEKFHISVETFPLVFTKHSGVKVYDFRTKNPLNQKLPKGYPFYALNKTDTMILVYTPTTKTVAWMQRGDVI